MRNAYVKLLGFFGFVVGALLVGFSAVAYAQTTTTIDPVAEANSIIDQGGSSVFAVLRGTSGKLILIGLAIFVVAVLIRGFQRGRVKSPIRG
jgi:hypothetical protein